MSGHEKKLNINDGKVIKTSKRKFAILAEKKGKITMGRTESDAPDIDGRVLLRGKGWKMGEFQDAKIIDSETYDLIAAKS